ncbi:TPA: PerC family transcriptional regulator [Escherichia coli]|nr:PerC family transcriptional regulator [Escherichia coli]DAI74199.1 MAG TPA: PerC transcriptional activator [Bacteriophage sp.]ELR9043105.1 PerC family transcriptional regulator [Escherichia coli]KJH02628.1 prophage regulatory protein [Escherichia coli]MCD9236618.1 PerC family transcriptional regulator [Escherichia coli]MCF3352030.1 PerC family transcriptional regulator [Escherichia coli]
MRRLECSRKAQRPPKQPDNLEDLKRSLKRTEKEMGIDGIGKSVWRNYQK